MWKPAPEMFARKPLIGNCLYDIVFVHYTVAAGLMFGVYLRTSFSAEQLRETYETYRYSDISQSV